MHAYLLIAQNTQRLETLKKGLLEKLDLTTSDQLIIPKVENSIETVRRIKKTLYTGIKASATRIVIIERIDLFAPVAQNALLKILEEPPPDTTFILGAENEYQVLPTIRSRTQIINDKTTGAPNTKIDATFKSFWMEIFQSNNIAVRLAKASEITTTRLTKDEVDTWLKDQLNKFHKLLIHRLGTNQNTRLLLPVQVTKIARELIKTRQLLHGNINLKLLIDHLFINMPSIEK